MKILFVCYANICRSYMAQELWKQALPQDTVFSRGLYADPSYRVPDKVAGFLAANRISPGVHRATPLREADLRQADIVFFMEQSHLDKIADRYAPYLEKMWLLNDYAFNREEDIADPIAFSGRDFEQAAEKLKGAVLAAAEKLHSPA